MNYRSQIYLIVVLLVLISACQRPLWKQQLEGFKPYEKKLFWYQWFGEDPHAAKPQIGEQVQIAYALQKGTTILSSSFGQGEPIYVQIPTSEFDNVFTKSLQLMGVGDSLHVKVKASTIPELLGNYANQFGEDDWVDFYYKVYAIKSQTELDAEIAYQESQMKLVNEELVQTITDYQQKTIKNLQKAESQLEYLVYSKGKDKAASLGDTVAIHYICYNEAGEKIDDSFGSMQPLMFEVGSTSILEGLNEGVQLLATDGAAFLVVPPRLGYGNLGSPPLIAPNSTLFFYVELLSIQ